MKDKRNEYIKLVAPKIAEAEKELLLGNNIQENHKKIEKLMAPLSFEGVLLLDDYMKKNKLLTK